MYLVQKNNDLKYIFSEAIKTADDLQAEIDKIIIDIENKVKEILNLGGQVTTSAPTTMIPTLTESISKRSTTVAATTTMASNEK